jgi:hypothetical protein
MLSEAALALIRDVFGRPGLFLTAPRIDRRIVQWGSEREARVLTHSAVVVSESEILRELQQGSECMDETAPGDPDFTIFAARPLPAGPVEHCFGSRIAAASSVRLKDARDSSACCIESLDGGWLFLIPNQIGSGWLLSVGCSAQSALARSRVIAGRIESIQPPAGEFPAAPRIVAPLCGGDWLACGTAGLAFDPICGDGTAHAVREAILASAVVRAISTGGDRAQLLSHYEARLTAGFYRHLLACREFYQAGARGSWWDGELESLREGLEWSSERMKFHGDFRYQLGGFELRPVAG